MSVSAHIAAQRTDHAVPHAGVVPGPGGGGVDVLQVARPAPDAGEAAQS